MKIEMLEVESSNVKAIGYDPETQTLRIQHHKKDRKYDYKDVSAEEFSELMRAKSIGSHLNRLIIPTHDCERVQEDETVGSGQDH